MDLSVEQEDEVMLTHCVRENSPGRPNESVINTVANRKEELVFMLMCSLAQPVDS